jgi:hypothetical protein
VQVLKGKAGFAFLDERELRLRRRWFHYSTPEVFAGQFRSPDWALWAAGDREGAVRVMRTLPVKTDRARTWRRAGVHVARLQVVDAQVLADPGSALNYLITYLEVTHPEEYRVLIDADRARQAGVVLPEVDFLIHDDDVAFTKYIGEPGPPGSPGVVYRDVYWNRAPAPGQDDDRPAYRAFAQAADTLLARHTDLAWTGPLPATELLARTEA